MADSKISELTELTLVDPSDLLAIVDDPSGTPVTKKVTVNNIADAIAGDSTTTVMNSSMARQAIINGNFDVWQRGTSVSLSADTTIYFLADRWFEIVVKDGGTPPTLTRSREILTSGDLYNSFYYTRLTTNGAGTSFGVNSQHQIDQRIENGVRLLCGDGKKVTLSFYARSSIANKKLGLSLRQNYGSGGSPSTQEEIKGGTITLTSSWVKYTKTFTTNTLAGKTFGTANDDYIQVGIFDMWGTTIGDARIETSVAAETFGGSGTIDIAQVQLCAGDVALPFMPKSFDEELRACQRYCVGLDLLGAAFITNSYSTAIACVLPVKLPTIMRIPPTLSFINISGSVLRSGGGGSGTGYWNSGNMVDGAVWSVSQANFTINVSGTDFVLLSAILTISSGYTDRNFINIEYKSGTPLLILSSEL